MSTAEQIHGAGDHRQMLLALLAHINADDAFWIALGQCLLERLKSRAAGEPVDMPYLQTPESVHAWLRECGTTVPDQARIRREHVRLLCLQHLDAVRPAVMADAALLPLIQAVYPDATGRELRRELDYLMERGLLTIVDADGRWRLKLTAQGIDLNQEVTA